MTITFEVSREQANQVEDARSRGIPVDNLFYQFVKTLPDSPKQGSLKVSDRHWDLMTLLQNWNQEDAELPATGDSNLIIEGEKFSADLLSNRVDLHREGISEGSSSD